jgi:hypothetical protein
MLAEASLFGALAPSPLICFVVALGLIVPLSILLGRAMDAFALRASSPKSDAEDEPRSNVEDDCDAC